MITKKEIKVNKCMGFYWAYSVYSLVMYTAVFRYYETVTSSNNGMVQFLGEFNNSSFIIFFILFILIVA
jgi:hypothetical protein